MIQKFPVSVKAVIERAGRYLMINGKTGDGVELAFPGGLVEEGEDLREALAREVREELGVSVDIDRVFHASKYKHPRGGVNVALYFSAKLGEGKIVLGSEKDKEFQSVEWISPEEAPGWAREIMLALKS